MKMLPVFALTILVGTVCHAALGAAPEERPQQIASLRFLAERGDAEAQVELAWCYRFGHGVEHDDAMAVHWYRRAAEQGDPSGQWFLGNLLREGEGTPRDDAEAFKWYLAASRQGHGNAQRDLANMYEHGRGVTKDLVQAYYWYRECSGGFWIFCGLVECECNSGMNNVSASMSRREYWRMRLKLLKGPPEAGSPQHQ